MEAHLYVIATSPQGARMLESMAAKDDWASIRIMTRGRGRGAWGKMRSSLGLAWCALRLRAVTYRIAPGERIALCHLANPYSRLICKIRRKAAPGDLITVVDDGTTTLNEHELLASQGSISVGNSAPRSRSAFASLERFLFSSATIDASQLEFFSFWPLAPTVSGRAPRLAERNDLSTLRSRLRSRPRRQVVHFIGQPFVRRGLLSESDYRAILICINHHYSVRGIEFRYFPHRNEDPAACEDLFEVVRLDRPYELFLLESEEWPRIIAGFCSACIITTLYLFRERLEYEVFWGFSQLRPEVVTSRAVAAAFEAESAGISTLALNTSLRLDTETVAPNGSV